MRGDATINAFKSEIRGGAWTHAAGLQDGVGPGSGDNDNMFPQVAMDNNGNAVVVWMNSSFEYFYDAGYYNIMVSEYR